MLQVRGTQVVRKFICLHNINNTEFEKNTLDYINDENNHDTCNDNYHDNDNV